MTDQQDDQTPPEHQDDDSRLGRAAKTLGRWESLLKTLAGVVAALTLVVGAVIGLTKAFGDGTNAAAPDTTSTAAATATSGDAHSITSSESQTSAPTSPAPSVFHSGRITLRQDQGISFDTSTWKLGSAVGADLGLTDMGADVTSASQIALMSSGQDQYADCAAVTDWQSQIDTGAYIKQGTLLCLHTTAGRYASAQVVGEQYDQNLDIILSFQITVWDLTSS